MVFCSRRNRPDEANNFIFVRSDRQMHKVLFKDILVVEGLENYVCIYTESTKLLVRSTMKRMIEALPGGVFQQVHKSYLINLEKIEMIDGNRIIVGRCCYKDKAVFLYKTNGFRN